MHRLSAISLFLILIVPGYTQAEMITLEQLSNLEYQGIYEQPVRLTDGRYEGEPFGEGDTSRSTVILIDTLIGQGDLTGDGKDDAAVLLAESSGGSGVFIYLAIVAEENGEWINTATTLMGERVQLSTFSVEGATLVTETISAAESSQKKRTVYELQSEMQQISGSETQETPSLIDLEGSKWRLRQLNFEQSVAVGVEVTAAFAEGQIRGFAGCNNYRAGIEDKGAEGIAIGPVAATRKMCPSPAIDVERVFLQQLRAVTGFRFESARLVLLYEADGATGEMVFDVLIEE